VPTFRTLPKSELDAVAASVFCKEYRAGDRLWRAGVHLDFIGIVQQGEIVVEYRSNGSMKYASLLTGDFLQPSDLRDTRHLSSVSVYAKTDVTLCVLRLEQLAALRSNCLTLDARLAPAFRRSSLHLPLGQLWIAAVAILICLLVWRDVARTLSGLFYLASSLPQQSGNYAEALDLLDYAAWFDLEAGLAYNQKGYLQFTMGESSSAMTAFAQALSMNKSNGPALNNLSVLYLTMGQVAQSEVNQQRAAEIEPNNAVVQYNWGLVLFRKKDNKAAIRALKEASRIAPSWPLPYLQLCHLYLQAGNYLEAERTARAVIRLDPLQQSAHLSLAIALHQQGQNQEALAFVENALLLNPHDINAGFYKALILRDLGKPDSALLMLQQLLDSSGDPEKKERIAVEIESLRRNLQAVSDP
jgi:tetratricopeptide (TPR) repeat protein